MLRIKKLLHELPDHNSQTLQYLASHLNKIASFGHVNKVTYLEIPLLIKFVLPGESLYFYKNIILCDALCMYLVSLKYTETHEAQGDFSCLLIVMMLLC